MVVDDAPPAEPATIANPLLAQYQTVHEAKMREMHVAIATNNCAIIRQYGLLILPTKLQRTQFAFIHHAKPINPFKTMQ